MHKRAIAAIAVVSGALALTATAIPAAQASGNTPAHVGWQQLRSTYAAGSSAQPFAATTATPAATGFAPLAVTFSNVKVNSGKAVYLSTGTSHVPYSFTLTGKDVDVTASDFFPDVDMYHGSDTAPDGDLVDDTYPACTVTSTTTDSAGSVVTVENCTGTLDVPGDYSYYETAQAGNSWHAVGYAVAFNGQDPSNPTDPSKIGYTQQTGLAAPSVLRVSRLSTNATPEPVKKNGTLTVVGALTRADWNTGKFTGYANVPVKLQFRKSGSSTYTTIKTVNTDSKGNLKTTAKATASGFWRYSFAGTFTTTAVNAAVDGVAVN